MIEASIPQERDQLNTMEAELEYMKTKAEKYANQSEEYRVCHLKAKKKTLF
jgi:hypothetical protein